MSIELILIIILVIFLLGGFSGRFGGYGYGFGHGGIGVPRRHPDHPRRAGSHGSALICVAEVSNAAASTKAFDDAIEALRQSLGKRVELLIGGDVARFILRFGGGVIG